MDRWWLAACASLAAALAGCDGAEQAAAPSPVDVKAILVKRAPAELFVDKVGEVRGSQEVDLRARVSGVLLRKEFADGSLVKRGQPLFSIDAREYRAQLASAQAQLASAQANLARARGDVARYEPLVKENAISRQVYDSAVATEKESSAQVEAMRAAIDEAKLSVEFATVLAPFDGRVGDARVFEGALITAGSTELVQIHRDDPVWVYFSVSEAELLEYQKHAATAPHTPKRPTREVQLQLSDGSVYPLPGFINFVATSLDSATGTFALRAEFANPEHKLVPGLFARIRVNAEQRADAIAVPDRAVQQQLGRYFVTVVGAGDKAEMRPVVPGPRAGNVWIIASGLAEGDRVVVEGLQKARPGTPLKVTLITPKDLDAAAAAGA
jgi:membrane fusion protein, multidrug efflux system